MNVLLVVIAVLVGAGFLSSCGAQAGPMAPVRTIESAAVMTPLPNLGAGTYLGFQGGLYPGGSNVVPDDHAAAGTTAATFIQPLDAAGNPSPTGKVVLASVGMSTTTQIYCHVNWEPVTCNSWTFTGQALRSADVDNESLVFFNGAASAQTSTFWDSPFEYNYTRVDSMLVARGLSPAQVQVAWILLVRHPTKDSPTKELTLPDPEANARRLERDLGAVVRSMQERWPNLRLVYLSSYPYGGYDTSGVVKEPYAYESGFAVKWVIEAQIEQARTGTIDAEAGDLSGAWLAWGPYYWVSKSKRSLFESDGRHPSKTGEKKWGGMLLDYLRAAPTAQVWFLR